MHSIAATIFELPASVTAATQRWKRVTPVALWQGFAAGAWSVVSEFIGNDCLYLVVRGNKPQARAARALAPREREVLEGVALGQSNKFVAYELGISQSCVSVHLSSARLKLGVRSKTEIVQLMRFGNLASIGPQTDVFCVQAEESVVLRVVREQGPPPAVLTGSEGFVFRAILDGLSNAEIASRRGRSPRTVANQVASVFRKLAIGSRGELVARYRDFAAVFQQENDPSPPPYAATWADRYGSRAEVLGDSRPDQRGLRAVVLTDAGRAVFSHF